MLTLIIFLMAGVLGAGVAALVMHKEKGRRRTRALNVIAGRSPEKKESGTTDGDAATTPAQKSQKASAADITKKLKMAAKAKADEHDTKSVRSLILQAGLTLSPLKFWIIALSLATAFSGLLLVSGLSDIVVGLLVFTAYFGAPRFFLRYKARRRQMAFLTDFADALEAMIRLIKAGMPVTEAIAMVGREFTGPMGEEMARIYDAQKVGTPLAEAVRSMVPRMPIAEVQMFATAIAVQVQTGSSLSEVLGNLSTVIRARARLKRKVRALSAEAKASAMIIGALPILVGTGLYLVNPDYIGLLFTHPTGKMLLMGAIVWMSFGVLMMRQMINFKV